MTIEIILSVECGMRRTVIFSTKMAQNLERDGYAVVCQMRFAMIRHLAMMISELVIEITNGDQNQFMGIF